MRAYIATVFATLALTASATSALAQSSPTRLPTSTVSADSSKALLVQNDRATPVRLFIDAGRVDRLLGTVAPGAVSTLELPEWALTGQRNLTVVARNASDDRAIASYSVAVDAGKRLGLLVPPADGLPAGDSLVTMLPTGSATAATVTVDNSRDRAVSVYAEQGLRFVKLGEVQAKSQMTLAIPSSLVRNPDAIRLFARPLGAAQLSTGALQLKEGDHVGVIFM